MCESRPVRRTILLAAFATLLAYSASGAARSLPDFTELAESAAPAVVNIGTTMKRDTARRGPRSLPNIPEDSPLNEFFRRFFGEQGPPTGMVPRSSLGSGFIISKDGYVISNYHVVANAEEIVVRLSDRREFVAELIGTDERSDLAVPENRRDGPSSIETRGFAQIESRRMGGSYWGSFWLRAFGDRRHRQRQRPELAERELRAVHSNRRRDKPR